MVKEQISLYYREGNSDKEYHVQLVSAGDLFAVNFQYGRRHSTLSEGSKTSVPVSFEQAKKTYDKLVKEKQGKPVYLGSREGEGIAKADNITTLKYKQDGVEDDS